MARSRKTPKWEKRLGMILSLPAFVLEFCIDFLRDFFYALVDAEPRELPRMKKHRY